MLCKRSFIPRTVKRSSCWLGEEVWITETNPVVELPEELEC